MNLRLVVFAAKFVRKDMAGTNYENASYENCNHDAY